MMLPESSSKQPQENDGHRDSEGKKHERFLEWVLHTQGAQVANRCRELFNDPGQGEKGPLLILQAARSDVYQKDLSAVYQLYQSTISTVVNVNPH